MNLTLLDKYRKTTILLLLFGVSFVIRLAAIFSFGDLENPEMYEFGIIARNLLNGLGYSFPAGQTIVPSAHMPPGLVYIYYAVFLFFGDNPVGYFTILFINALLAGASVVVVYLVADRIYEDRNVSLLSGIYVTISPILIYSTIIFNSIVIYQLLSGTCLLLYLKSWRDPEATGRKASWNGVGLGIAFGLLFYFRAEMIAFMLIIAFVFLIRKRVRTAFAIVFTSLLILSPWTIRNYSVFGKFIPVATSLGVNFNQGHGEDNADRVAEISHSIRKDSAYEVTMSDSLFALGIESIKNNPASELNESLSKVFSLWLYDKYYPQSRNLVYMVFWGLSLTLFIYGMFRSQGDKESFPKLSFILIYLVFTTVLVVVFFNIPRYQIQMSYLMVPTMMYGLLGLVRAVDKRREV